MSLTSPHRHYVYIWGRGMKASETSCAAPSEFDVGGRN